jgi:hypothetical protein
METSQIHEVGNYQGKQSYYVCRRRLRELEHEGLILSHRPSAYRQKVFYLTKEGADLVVRHKGLDEGSIRIMRKDNPKIVHYLKIVDVYLNLRHLSQRNPRYRLLSFETNVTEWIYGRERIHPDALSILQIDDKKMGTFWEVDTGEETIRRVIHEKVEKYESLERSGAVQKRYPGAPFFPIVILTSGGERAINLRSRIHNSQVNPQIRFIVGVHDDDVEQLLFGGTQYAGHTLARSAQDEI